MRRTDRSLIIIGGHEAKEGDKLILRAVAERTGSKLVIITAASNMQDELAEEYERLFRGLGVRHIYKLMIRNREDALSDKSVRIMDGATSVFFTGGDQLRITSQLGLSPVCARIQEVYESGGTIAGTSAGASVMTETMMVGGNGSQTPRLGNDIELAPGLGLLHGVIVDQHFSERGRIGRLLGAVAKNPRILGVGIDENTAVMVERDNVFKVIGEGGVCFVDGGAISYTNITEEATDRAISIFDARIHTLSQGDSFDCRTRTPSARPAEEIEDELLSAAVSSS